MAERTTKPRTGTVVYVPAKPGEAMGHYKVRVTSNDGSRPWIHLQKPSPKSPQAEARAREKAAAWSERAGRDGVVLTPARKTKASEARRVAAEAAASGGETVKAYAARWFADRARRGLTSVATDVGRFNKWIAPTLGALPIATVTRRDVEALVENLDRDVQAEKLAWRTAGNAWALVTKLFDDARRSKTLAMRVRDDNPAADVRGPDSGAKVAKVYLYPSEFSKLLACEEVPVAWRRIFVATTYLYLRAAEVRGLKWEDVDVEHRRINVHRTLDDAGVERSTKGEEARPVPIEPSLLPMLAAMRAEVADDSGRVFPKMLSECRIAPYLRRFLLLAGVDRTELHKSTKTRRRLRYHDLRATGITWRAIRGDEPLKMMQAAGHKDFETTMAYIRTADQVRSGFGDVFPTLPAELLGPENRPENRPTEPNSSESLCRRRDSNPRPGAYETPALAS